MGFSSEILLILSLRLKNTAKALFSKFYSPKILLLNFISSMAQQYFRNLILYGLEAQKYCKRLISYIFGLKKTSKRNFLKLSTKKTSIA